MAAFYRTLLFWRALLFASRKRSGTVSPMLTLSHPSLQIVRGFAGAVLFSFPMLMTMEMWSLGVSIAPARLMLFITVYLILLVGMASYARHDAAIVTMRD